MCKVTGPQNPGGPLLGGFGAPLGLRMLTNYKLLIIRSLRKAHDRTSANAKIRTMRSNESPQPSSPPTQAHHQRRPASIGPLPHTPIQKARASDISPRPPPFASFPNAAPVSLPSHFAGACYGGETGSAAQRISSFRSFRTPQQNWYYYYTHSPAL